MNKLDHKIPPPLVALITALLMWGSSRFLPHVNLGGAATLLAAALFALGGVISVLGVLSFRKASTTVNPLAPDTASSLVTSGIYRFTRNPMYLGLSVVLLGLGLFLSSPWVLLWVPVFMAYIQRFQVLPEEQAMQKLFGESFTKYRQSVRRWL